MAVQGNVTLFAGRYRVIRRLGSGGAATVFLCEDERLGRKVAVKRMHAHSPEDITRRLRREARLGASLSHPNLVSVFDTETYEEGVFIVMEYVDGETLADALGRGPLDSARALEILRALASALDHVHAQGIVHRDVKPANVLLGKDGSVKLADLGVGIATDQTRITQSGQVLGTPAYMSPEQIDGAVPTAAGDIYALGAVAYEMLTGQKARTGSTPLEVAHHVTTQPPPDLRRAWPDAPPAAAEAIKRTMARDPGRRPALAREFVDELSHALTGPRTGATRPLLDRTVVMSSPEPPPARRRTLPRWTPLLVLLLLAGVAGLAVALGSGGGGSSSTNQTSGHRQRSQSSHRSQTNAAQSTSTPAPQTSATTPPATDPSALNDQGKALIDSGRPADAIPVLQEALAAFPADQRSSLVYAYTLFNLADAYLRSGQPDKAIPLLRERLKYNDQTAVVQAELEQAMRQAGQLPSGKHGHGKKKGKGGGA